MLKAGMKSVAQNLIKAYFTRLGSWVRAKTPEGETNSFPDLSFLGTTVVCCGFKACYAV